MRQIILSVAGLLLTFSLIAQTTLISPSGDGGFETGSTFAANGWTVVNGSATSTQNQWYLGTNAIPGIGSGNVAYITNNTTTAANTYSNSGAMYVVHFYRDITFPAGETKIALSFLWKGVGETGAYDGLQISLAPTSVTPAASSSAPTGAVTSAIVSGATYVGNPLYWNQSTAATTTIYIPGSLAGNTSASSTMRLIFTFRLDGSLGSNPPTSIDNISLVTAVANPLHGSYTLNNTLPTTSPMVHDGTGNFNTFTDAINYIYTDGFTSAVMFNVTAGQTFTETPPVITFSGSLSNPIVFQKSGSGANPKIVSGTGSGSNDAILSLKGADYLTFDGIDLQDNAANTTATTQMEYGYYIFNTSATDGATNNTIRNSKITLNRTNTSTRGIYQYAATSATNATGCNSYNKYYNIVVENSCQGIYLSGTSTSYPDLGCEIGGISGGSTIIGAATANDIGNSSSTSYGIYAGYQSGINIYNTEVRNVTVTSTASACGIYTSSCMGTCNIYNNKVHDIKNTSTSATTSIYPVYGSLSGTATMNLYNNFIYGITSAYTGSASTTRQIKGIYLVTATTGQTFNVSYNSVRIDGSSSPNISSSCFEISSTTGAIIVTKDNIFANLTGAQTTAKHYCWVSTSATLVGIAGSSSNYNDLYISNTTNGFVGLGNATDFATLSSWQTAMSQDANSKSTDPQFVSSTDLHAQAVLLDGAAIPVEGITTDIDGETRNATTPDIGADEFTPASMAYVSGTATQANTSTIISPSATNEILGLQIVMSGTVSPLSVTGFTLNTNGSTSPATDLANAKLWSTGASPTFATTSQYGSTVAAPNGAFTFTGSLTLLPGTNYFWLTYDALPGVVSGNLADAEFTNVTVGTVQTPTVSAPAGSRVIRGPLSGTYTIDPYGSGITNYTSFGAAVADLNLLGIGGTVTFNVAAGATFSESPLTINTTGTSVNTVTFQKSGSGANPILNFTGTASTDACFRLNGADYYTFDGLTVQDAGSAMEYGFYLYGSTGTNGCQNNTVKNCVIDMNKSNTSSYGVYLYSVATASTGANSNNKFYNNTVQDCYSGYFFTGASGAYDDNNEVGTLAGGTSSVTGLGGSSTSVYGVYGSYQTNFKIHHTAISNLSGSGYVYAIYESTGASNTTYYYNNDISTVASSGSTYTVAGIYVSTGTTHEIHHNTVTDISASASSSYAYGLYLVSGTNTVNNNTLSNIRTTNSSGYSAYGVYLSGTANTVFGNSVATVTCASTSSYGPYGVYFSSGTTNNFYQNSVHGVTSATYHVYGVFISGGTTTNLYRNSIYDISYTGSSSFLAVGLQVGGGTTNTFSNNFIYDIRAAASTGTPGVRAIALSGGTTDNLYSNTVYLDYTSTVASNQSAALYLTVSPGTVDLRNNLFVNRSVMTTGTRAVALYKTSSSVANLASTCNNNLYFAGTPGAANLIAYDGSTSYQTLSAFKTWVSPRETASVTENPPFLSATAPYDLHMSNSIATQCESGGAAVSGITDDYDGDIRFGNAGYSGTGTAPDMGADEFNGIAADLTPPLFSGVTTVNGPCDLVSRNITVSISDFSGVDNTTTFKPRIYFKKRGGSYVSAQGALSSGTVNSGTWTFMITYSTVGGVSVSDTIDYFVVAQDVASPSNAGGTPSTGLVLTDVNTVTTPPTSPYSYVIRSTIGGTYNVGAGQTYTTLSAAIQAYNTSCLTGAVTFLLTDAAYTEAAALTINANSDASPTNTLTIKPTQAGTTLGVTGGSTTAILILNGADYVTLDGSTGNTVNACCSTPASRDLTISNANSGTGSAVIWLQSNGTDGATHNTVKNCNLAGNSNTTTLFGLGSGSSSIGTSSLGSGNSFNSFINNSISKTQYGIYTQGAGASAKNTGNTISQNLINAASPDNVAKGGIWTGYEDNLTISCNVIDGISQSSSPDVFGITCGFGISVAATSYSGNEVTNAVITKNVIGGVINSGTFSAYGIGICSASSGTNLVANNMIYGVKANATSGDIAAGIVLGGGTGSTTRVYYNSVSMQGTITGSTAASQTTACLAITNSTEPVVDIRDNIFSNTQLGNTSATLRFTAIALAYSTYTNLLSNYNDLYAAGAGPGTYAIGITGGVVSGTSRTTLANWQSTTGKDGASVNILPVFTALTDLHLVPGSNYGLNDLGTPLSVTDDIDCASRSVTAPDMGADEFDPPVCTAATGGTAAGDATFCASGTPTVTASGYSVGLGSAYQWYYSNNAADYPGSGTILAGQTNPATCVTGVVTTTTYFWLMVSCPTKSSIAYSNMVTVTIHPSVAAISGPSAICAGSAAVTLTETGGTGTSWLWSTTETTQSISVSPASTTVYTVTVTSPGSCTATATRTITVNPLPSVSGVTATPNPVCEHGTLNLAAAGTPGVAGYSIHSVGYAPIASGTGTTILCNAGSASTALTSGTLDDGYWNGITLPFNFIYFGTSYSSVNIQTNGIISFSSFSTATGYSSNPHMPNTAVPNNIAGMFGDLEWTFGGKISCYTSGVAPNRIFVIDYNGSGSPSGGFYNIGSAPTTTVNFQIQLFENGNRIQIHTTTITSDATRNHTMGVENSGGTSANVVTGRNYSLWSLSNDGTEFTPANVAYAWSGPNAFTSAIQNPSVTNIPTAGAGIYSVTVTDNNGCVTSSATPSVVVNTAPVVTVSPSAPVIAPGAIQSLTASAAGDPAATFSWSPVTDLFTDALATVPYTGGTATTVWSKPATTITYTVTGTSSTSGCTGTASVTVTISNPVTVTGTATNASCPSAADGSIDITAAGGIPPYTYLWSNLATTADLTGLNPGTYTVTVTDAGSSTVTGSWNVGNTSEVCGTVTLTGTITGTECHDAMNLLVTGGTGSFVVASGANVNLVAGLTGKIRMMPGTHALSGSHLHAYLSDSYCSGIKAPMVAAAVTENPVTNLNTANFILFPNPTTGDFTLMQKGDRNIGSVRMEIYSMRGEHILSGQMDGEMSHHVRFEGLPDGMYFVKVIGTGYVETLRLVKSK